MEGGAGQVLGVWLTVAAWVIGLGLIAVGWWAFIDCVLRQFGGPIRKLFWLLVIAVPVIGPILYVTIGRSAGKFPPPEDARLSGR
jgi:hypothetical protein